MLHQTPPLFSEILLEHSSSMSCTSLAQLICCLTIVRYCEYCITGGLPCGVGSFPSSLGMFTINGRNLAMSAVCWLFSRAKRCNKKLSLVFLFIIYTYAWLHEEKYKDHSSRGIIFVPMRIKYRSWFRLWTFICTQHSGSIPRNACVACKT